MEISDIYLSNRETLHSGNALSHSTHIYIFQKSNPESLWDKESRHKSHDYWVTN